MVATAADASWVEISLPPVQSRIVLACRSSPRSRCIRPRLTNTARASPCCGRNENSPRSSDASTCWMRKPHRLAKIVASTVQRTDRYGRRLLDANQQRVVRYRRKLLREPRADQHGPRLRNPALPGRDHERPRTARRPRTPECRPPGCWSPDGSRTPRGRSTAPPRSRRSLARRRTAARRPMPRGRTAQR